MDKATTLAERLEQALASVPARGPDPHSTELADLAARLSESLATLPPGTRRLVHTADSGFASQGTWVDDAITKQNDQVGKLARAAGMVAAWHGPDGTNLERTFVIRGHVRGWAHRWRQEEKGPAQVDGDPDFVAFAGECLQKAGIDGDPVAIIGKALGKDWRTAE